MNQQIYGSEFRKPMQPFPGLEKYSRTIWLPEAGINLFAYDTGEDDKPAALLVHGLGDEADTWRHLIQPMSYSWRVIAPDLPGFGRSGGSPGKDPEGYFLQALIELLSNIGIKKTMMVGHSLGAALVHRIALDHRNLVSKLVLIDGSLLIKPASTDLRILLFLIPWVGEWLYNRLRKNPQAAFKTLQTYCADLDSLSQEDLQFLYQRVNERVWSDTQRTSYFSTLRNYSIRAVRQQRRLVEQLAGLKVLTLIFWGEMDGIYSTDGGHKLLKIQPDAHLILLPGVGHNAHQEQPETILKEITRDNSSDQRLQVDS